MITVSDDGTDLTYSMTGSIDRSGDAGVGIAQNDDADIVFAGGIGVLAMDGDTYFDTPVGVTVGADPFVGGVPFLSSPSAAVGASFGFLGERLVWDDALGNDPDTIVVDVSFVDPGETVASVFGTNLDGGPVVLWTHTNSGDTVSIQAIPEPSSSLLLVAGVAGLAFRRNRK